MSDGVDIEKLLADVDARKAKRTALMPDDATAINTMFQAYLRLKEMGWNDACYCPKDGTVFEVIEAGSAGIHHCHYQGEWPKGSWWVHDNGDLWPSRPILFRKLQAGTDK